ncbi:hypothetical protein [Leptospira sp. GIMC2001]|uniref:hypothetical protein n=1 Tax=Leptospira sp. GIMC2001 TaxID=1513297 RepID=UPI002349C0E2|nr:hypothetical protein [Leptospira sp. GIMC2001]WCL47857.1 hypothetical protein O4O04_11020 [Leptospira sp. GIMC2001]
MSSENSIFKGMGTKLFSQTILLLSIFLVQSVYAEAWVPTSKASRKETSFTMDYGGVSNDNDYFLHLSPNLSYNLNEEFGLSLSLPLNLLMLDNEPKLETSRTGQLREYDYNEAADYFRVINYIWYGQYEREAPGKLTYSLYVGDIRDGRIGHGTIVNQYYNNVRFDVYNAGVLADFNSDYVGVQFFSNSLYSRDVNAARVYIKPLALGRLIYRLYNYITVEWEEEDEDDYEYIGMMQSRGNVVDEAGRKSVIEEVDPLKRKRRRPIPRQVSKYSKMEIEENDAWYNRLTIGTTRSFDSNKPYDLQYSQTGIPTRQENRDLPIVAENGKVNIEGYDIEYRLLNMKYWEFTPYMDVNRIRELENSGGTHYGFMARFGDKDINVVFKPELRRMSSNYIPMYFDSFYEVERFHGNLTSTDPMIPKFRDAEGKPTSGGISGYFHTLLLNYYGYSLEASFEKYEGERNSRIFLASYIPLGSNLTLSFFYTKKGFDGTGEAFKLDDASLGAAELSLPIGPIQLRLQNLRRWTYTDGDPGFKSFDEQRILMSSSFAL